MTTTKKILEYVLEDSFNFEFTDNRLILGDKADKVNILFSCSPNPLEHMKLFRELVEDRKPVIWIKDNFSDQMFRNHDLLEFLPNFNKVITILSPEPEKEEVNIELYGLPKELFRIKLFDQTEIVKSLGKDASEISEEDKNKAKYSINNLMDSILHQESFNYSNFLVSTETSSQE